MQNINIIYHSHLGNTSKFVLNHLAPALSELPFTIITHRLHSPAPHQPAVSEPAFSASSADRNLFLFVFPCYGRTNPETKELEDMVPMPMRNFIKRVERETLGQVIGGVVCGNRTFGSDFVNVKGQFNYPVLGQVELAGSATDAQEVLSRLQHPSSGLL